MLRTVWPVDAPAVAEAIGESFEADVPVVAGAVFVRVEFDFGGFARFIQRFDDQRNGGTVLAQEGKVDGGAENGRAQRQRAASEDSRSHEMYFNSSANVRPRGDVQHISQDKNAEREISDYSGPRACCSYAATRCFAR